MTNPSSPAAYSSSNSMRSSSTWSPSPYASFSDDPYSTPSGSQPSTSQASNSPSFDGQKAPYREYGQLNGDRYLESRSTSSAYPQNVGSAMGFCGSPGYELSSWSSNEAEGTRGTFLTGSLASQPGHGSMGMGYYSPQLENVRGVMEYQNGYAAVSHASLNDSQIRTGLAIPLEGREDTTVRLSVGVHVDGLPYQENKCRCNRPDGQDLGDELIRCKIPECRTKQGFKNRQSFEAHIRNVHVDKIFKCLIDNCPRPGPFSNKHDLKRHIATTHKKAKPYRCQRPNCRARAKEFSRKDKLKDHDRKHHAEFKCWYCSQDPRLERWFELEQELWDHTNKEHPGLHPQGQ